MEILGTSIAVAQCADRVTGLLAKVKILINAPLEVDVLIKDVATLKALVCDVRDTIVAISTSSVITLEKTQLLRTLIEEGSQILLELEKLIEYEFKELDGRDNHGQFKVHRTAWARNKSKVEQLRDRMRDLKLSISVLVSSMVLVSSVRTYDSVEKSISMAGLLLSCSADIQRHMVSNQDQHREILSQSIQHQQDECVLSPDMSKSPSVKTSVVTQLDPIEAAADASEPRSTTFSKIRLRFQQLYECRSWCTCVCHRQTRIESPAYLRGLIGTIRFRCPGVSAISSACNDQACKKRSRMRLQLNYVFPQWMLSCVLNISLLYRNPGGPQLLLKMPRVRSAKDDIFVYATQGDVKGIRSLLLTGQASSSDVDQSYQSALFLAIDYRHLDVAELLLNEGADPYQADAAQRTPFHIAWNVILSSSSTNSEYCNVLRTLFPETEALETRQFSDLHQIVLGLRGGDPRIHAKSAKTSINQVDSDGRTALSWAAKCGKGDIVMTLLEEGADPCIGDPGGRTPLHRVMAATNPSCIGPLLGAGAKVDAGDFQDSTALHYAASWSYSESDLPLFFDPILSGGANIDAQITSGHTALHIAIRRNLSSNAIYLIKRGVNIDLCDNGGTSSLMYSIEHNRHPVLTFALSEGADGSLVDKQGMTLLHYAATYGDLKTLRLLNRYSHRLKDLQVAACRNDSLTAIDLAEKRQGMSQDWIAAFAELVNGLMDIKSEDSSLEDV